MKVKDLVKLSDSWAVRILNKYLPLDFEGCSVAALNVTRYSLVYPRAIDSLRWLELSLEKEQLDPNKLQVELFPLMAFTWPFPLLILEKGMKKIRFNLICCRKI